MTSYCGAYPNRDILEYTPRQISSQGVADGSRLFGSLMVGGEFEIGRSKAQETI
jgi:hypothetical protein